MKYQYLIFLTIGVLTFSSCKDKSYKAASMICDCNSDLVEFNQKLNKLKEANDVNSIAEMQPEGDKLIEEAERCFEKMEAELGGKLMNNKEFEVKVMSRLEESCLDVFESYQKVTLE